MTMWVTGRSHAWKWWKTENGNRRPDLENSPALQLEQQRLTRKIAVLTGVFTTLKQQLETTKIEEVKQSDYVVVLDPPEAPLVVSQRKNAWLF